MNTQHYTAFEGTRLLAHGDLPEVALAVRQHQKSHPSVTVLVFSDSTGKQMDFDLSGSEKDVRQRLQVYLSPEAPPPSASGPGRPKLGVMAREVSLLPRHWEWLATQPQGASATLRRLVDAATKTPTSRDLLRQAQDRTYKFMSALAGNLPFYEEALRALYAKDKKRFREQMADWPADIRAHALRLADGVF